MTPKIYRSLPVNTFNRIHCVPRAKRGLFCPTWFAERGEAQAQEPKASAYCEPKPSAPTSQGQRGPFAHAADTLIFVTHALIFTFSCVFEASLIVSGTVFGYGRNTCRLTRLKCQKELKSLLRES